MRIARRTGGSAGDWCAPTSRLHPSYKSSRAKFNLILLDLIEYWVLHDPDPVSHEVQSLTILDLSASQLIPSSPRWRCLGRGPGDEASTDFSLGASGPPWAWRMGQEWVSGGVSSLSEMGQGRAVRSPCWGSHRCSERPDDSEEHGKMLIVYTVFRSGSVCRTEPQEVRYDWTRHWQLHVSVCPIT